MSTKKEKIREFAKETVKRGFFKLAEEYKEKGNVFRAKIYLCSSLKLEVESYHKKNHSAEIKRDKTIKTEEESRSVIYFAHYTSVETIYSILEKYQPQREKKENQGHNNQKNKFDSKEDSEKNANISSGLRLSDASYSNDPSEGNYLKKEITKDHQWLNDAKKSTDGFVCSFISGNEHIGDKVTYWQAYGKDGLGCALQLPLTCNVKYDKTGKIIKKGWEQILNPVLYGKDEVQKVKDHFKEYFDFGKKLYNLSRDETSKKDFATDFWKIFDRIKYLYKHNGYEHEKEYRLVQVSKNPQEKFVNKNPYLQRYILDSRLKTENILASGSKIVLGPKILKTFRLCQHLKNLAKAKGLYGPQFTSSKIPYRKVW